ncbi:uncharacterized protein AC631_00915 [Debaryomyces fabryi]|uniref:Uncharacterized protein n=1 Tax=Debaryomyces fabryi TaxID=58627 RepID=A0A0V1Q446_9ASCO|nr:uncharacterized protein AC631_00915 [Debaryomyces fabryi]KSA03277.1 hypothetical protein AC631_00915 [Debaryomyces fabryi]
MSGSVFSSGDPWENGWASNDNDNIRSPTIPGFDSGSTYLTSSQLLSHEHKGDSDISGEFPASYGKVYSELSEEISTVTDLERLVVNKLVDAGYLTNYQSSKILNTLYDHAILPPSEKANFERTLGLIALELDAAGTGEYVTLQMRLNNLPELSDKVVHLLINKGDNIGTKDITDPLGAQLANTGLTENDGNEWHTAASEQKAGGQASILSDPILTDHTAVQKSHLEGGDQQPIDHSHITKYINDIRDTFTPLVDTKETIKIKEVPEKEGLVFKHINYIISHDLNLGMHGPAGMKKVIRRYSDFVWYVIEFDFCQHIVLT